MKGGTWNYFELGTKLRDPAADGHRYILLKPKMAEEGEEIIACPSSRKHIKEEGEETVACQPQRKPIKEEEEGEEIVACQPPRESEEEEELVTWQPPRKRSKEEEGGEEIVACRPTGKSEEEEEIVTWQPPRKRTKEEEGGEEIVACRPTGKSEEQEELVAWQPPRKLTKEEGEELVACHPTRNPEEGEAIDLVLDILATPFSTRSFNEQLAIVRRGRPTPKLASLSQQGKGFVRHFQASNYERYPWLTASEKRCKLYCWDCLLLAADRRGAWSYAGFANLGCLSKAATKHQCTAGHLHATVLLQTFGDPRVGVQPSAQAQTRRETELHNERARKNREILTRLMDCVVFLGKQELSFSGQSANRGNYVELISFLAEHDTDLHYHLTTNSVFAGTPGNMQNHLIYAVAEVMAEEIKAEIKGAPFVSVMVEETTDVGKMAQLALALRYVTATGVKERFVQFADGARPADDLAALIFHFLEEYECCLDKVVAQCYDGAAATASGLNEVQAKVKQKAPMALFIHCHAHRLDLVLAQGASKLKECKVFFANLYGIAAFFSRSPTCTQLLDDMCKLQLPHAAPMRWQNASRLVNAVCEKRAVLKQLFAHILDHHHQYDGDTLLCADGFNARLDDFEFCFLLNTFNGMFGHADVSCGTLQTKTLDVEFYMEKVTRFCDIVEQARGKFSEIYEETARIAGGPSVHRGQGAVQGDLRAHYQQLHISILDNILCQMRNRFQDHEKLTFLSLLDPRHFKTYRRKFPQTAFSSLTQSHGTLFDLPRLKTQLTVMYAMADFEGKSPADLHDFLQRKNLSETMGQLYALACLALTIPVSTPADQPSFSALKRIETYARNTSGRTRLSALASMSIEKDFLMELKRTGELYNRAIEVFLRRERRMDFAFK